MSFQKTGRTQTLGVVTPQEKPKVEASNKHKDQDKNKDIKVKK